MSVQKSEGMSLSKDIVENVLVAGDLSKLNADQRMVYYSKLCESLGLNPLTRPMEYIKLQGKETLYFRKDATEQLRKINSITIDKIEGEILYDSVYVVTAHAHDKNERHDISKGAVSIAGLKGDSLANAIMKAETKAKRRVTLSICGLGFLDESELDSISELKTNNTPKITRSQKAIKEDETSIDEKILQYELNMVSAKTMEELAKNFLEARNSAHSVGVLEKYKDRLVRVKEKRKSELEIEMAHSEYVNEMGPVEESHAAV